MDARSVPEGVLMLYTEFGGLSPPPLSDFCVHQQRPPLDHLPAETGTTAGCVDGAAQGFAAAVSYFVNHPDFTSPDELRVRVAFACAMLCQLANLKTHITLANLRKPGDKGYKIPRCAAADSTHPKTQSSLYDHVKHGPSTVVYA